MSEGGTITKLQVNRRRLLQPTARPASCLLVAVAFLTSAAALSSASAQQQAVLADFKGTKFDYVFGGFRQAIGASSTRLTDSADGAGGVGRRITVTDFSSFSDCRLVVDFTTQPNNRAGQFVIELTDANKNAGKWLFRLHSAKPGVRTTLVSTSVLASPEYGIGDFRNLDLSNITNWQILGDYGSTEPFDISFERIAIVKTSDFSSAYLGADAGAAWRAEAAARIEAHRKADLRVTVVDASGNPVPKARVVVSMQEHEFGFGSAVQAHRLASTSAANEPYKAKTKKLFNIATLENTLKWPAWEGQFSSNFGPAIAVAALDWLENEEIQVRGHTLIWPGRKHLPEDIQELISAAPLNPGQLAVIKARISQHITELTAATRGRLVAWDVVNEPRNNNDLTNLLGETNESLVDWFKQVEAADPSAARYLNEYGILPSYDGRLNSAQQDKYFNTISGLQQAGAPIEGIGFQGHFSGSTLTGPEHLWDILDRFESLGLDMQVTEFDIDTTDESLQAAYTRDFMTAIFAHKGINALLLWGFWEDAHFKPNAAMFRSNWSIKPNGQAYLDLVFSEWWTDESLVADANGIATLRGFKGEYLVEATHGKLTASTTGTLSDNGLELTVTLPVMPKDLNSGG